MKDGPEGDTVVSKLEQVQVGIDDDGEAITSCVVRPAEESPQEPTSTPKLSPVVRQALAQLHESLAEFGEKAPASEYIPSTAKTVTLEQWRDRLHVTGIINKNGSYREQFKRIRVTLQNAKIIGVYNDLVWSVTCVT